MRCKFASFWHWALIVSAAPLFGPPSLIRAAEAPAGQGDDQQRAGALVAQAIEAEIKADLPRRGELLEQALLAAPNFAPARWQLGQVHVGQDWLSVDASVEQARQDDLLTQYHEMRTKYGESKEGQLVLAHWCQKHQLADELRAHAMRLLALSPSDPEALKLLNVSWHDGMLLTPGEIAARKAVADHDKALLKKWQPRLTELRTRLESKSSGESESALEELSAIRDPEAVDALEIVFKNRPTLWIPVLNAVGKIPGQKGTELLLRQAMLSKREDVRLAACRQLRERPRHSYVPTLMAAMSMPLETRFDVVRDANGVHFRQTIRRENANAVVEDSFDTDVTTLVPNPNLGAIIGQTYTDTFVSAQKTAKNAAMMNRKAAEYNGLIYWILEHTTGERLPHDPESWWGWWRDYNELITSEKPTLANNSYQSVTVPYVPYLPPDIPIYGATGGRGRYVRAEKHGPGYRSDASSAAPHYTRLLHTRHWAVALRIRMLRPRYTGMDPDGHDGDREDSGRRPRAVARPRLGRVDVQARSRNHSGTPTTDCRRHGRPADRGFARSHVLGLGQRLADGQAPGTRRSAAHRFRLDRDYQTE